MRLEVLRMERVRCLEQGVVLLDNFNLSILSGEIMGLLPLNNHGLTCLLRLLQRNSPLNFGYVYYKEEQINTWRATKQRHNKIGLIQSESSLVDGLKVVDNLFLKSNLIKWIRRQRIFEIEVAPFLESLDISICANGSVEGLTDFERIVVEVVKSVTAGHRLILLREISANISANDLIRIYRLLRYYSREGISFLYIDFHLEELLRICDRVALMSKGRIIKTITGKTQMPDSLFQYTQDLNNDTVTQIQQISKKSKKSFLYEVKGINGAQIYDLSFSVVSGECVILHHTDVKALNELLLILSNKKQPNNAEMLIDGKRINYEMGGDVAVIQELPTKTMLFNELSFVDNLCFLLDRRFPEIWYSNSLKDGIREEYAKILGDVAFDSRINDLKEIQKYNLVYFRISLQMPKVVFCMQPFRQADVELRKHIIELMHMFLNQGIALVILTVNVLDSLSIADKLIHIHTDKPAELFTHEEFSSI